MMAENPEVNFVEPVLEEKNVRREWLHLAAQQALEQSCSC